MSALVILLVPFYISILHSNVFLLVLEVWEQLQHESNYSNLESNLGYGNRRHEELRLHKLSPWHRIRRDVITGESKTQNRSAYLRFKPELIYACIFRTCPLLCSHSVADRDARQVPLETSLVKPPVIHLQRPPGTDTSKQQNNAQSVLDIPNVPHCSLGIYRLFHLWNKFFSCFSFAQPCVTCLSTPWMARRLLKKHL